MKDGVGEGTRFARRLCGRCGVVAGPARVLPNGHGSKGTATPMANKRDQHRTLQDDRAALEIDVEAASPLVEGEGAPLAEDGLADKPHAKNVVVAQALMGGAPLCRSRAILARAIQWLRETTNQSTTEIPQRARIRSPVTESVADCGFEGCFECMPPRMA